MVMAHILIWCISAVSIAAMLFRPYDVPEVIWAAAGALLLCATRLVSWRLAGHAVAEGFDVYLFLTGMMLLSELAKVFGVFDWLANIAVSRGNGSPVRLFTLVYAAGTAVTVFMSNDATAVVLTPAVLTALRRAEAEPLPYLLICALVANAASFVLPISNPANLVVFHTAMPPLPQWMVMFALPSFVCIVVTYYALRWYCRKDLRVFYEIDEAAAQLSASGRITLYGILSVAAVLLVASTFRMNLGLPTCVASLCIAAIVLLRERVSPWRVARDMSWSVLPLVAALFVLVEAVKTAGATQMLHVGLMHAMHWPPAMAALAVGTSIGFGTDLVNNLPLGLLAGSTLQQGFQLHPFLIKAVLIGIDLGPNLSITGSLATILWLIAIRREGLQVSGLQFLRAGLFIMPVSLVLSIGSALLFGPH